MDFKLQTRRPTTPDEAMSVLRGDHGREAVVEANNGNQVVDLRPTRFGSIQANIFIEVLKERRSVEVTEDQARRIVCSARRPDEDGDTLRLIPPEESEFDIDAD